MRIIAFDPGEETGWAHGYIKDSVLHIVDHGWTPWVECCYRFAKTQMGENPFEVVIYETWNLRLPKELYGSDMPSSQCIGQIKAAATWFKPAAMLVRSAPANKPVADSFMRKLAVSLPTSPVEHNRDAVRHLVHYSVHKLGVREVIYDQ